MAGGTLLPLELSLYTTIPPFLVHQHPYLNIQRTIHVPNTANEETIKVQRPNTVYPPDRAGHLSNASFIVPIADFQGVGHPTHLRPKHLVKRFVADAEWSPAEGKPLQLANYKAGLRDLQKKKRVFKWTINRTDEERKAEWKAGFRRSGEDMRKKVVL
jgi:hypothetical protein